MHTLIPKKKCH